MRYLLDTHVVLWLGAAPERIPAGVMELMEDPSNTLLFSIASIWEIVIKAESGKLRITIDELLRELEQQPFEIIPVALRHMKGLEGLPAIHKDPFDRMLIAQTIVDNLTIVSADGHFGKYGVPVFW